MHMRIAKNKKSASNTGSKLFASEYQKAFKQRMSLRNLGNIML